VLGPDHAVWIGGALIPVRHAVNSASVVHERAGKVTYFHIKLTGQDGAAVHDVLRADGLPAESYLDTGNRGAFEHEFGLYARA
jgi:hypothetical protein